MSEMPIERLGGAVVYAKHGGEIYLALVHDIFGHWTLAKAKSATSRSLPMRPLRRAPSAK